MIDRYRSARINLRGRFEATIKPAGLILWPRRMQNLRAFLETELLSKLPAKEVANWSGNRVLVAMLKTRWRRPRASARRSRRQPRFAVAVAS